MTTYQVEELTGALLDAAVAKAEGIAYRICNSAEGQFLRTGVPGSGLVDGYHDLCVEGYRPSEDWSAGGPIIEREGICLIQTTHREGWHAGDMRSGDLCFQRDHSPTPLLAAMRYYVGRMFGDTIEL